MSDDIDRAQAADEAFRERALAKLHLHVPDGRPRSHCEDCGDAIPAARRKAAPNCTRCIACQRDFERHGG